MIYLLDTSTISALMARNQASVRRVEAVDESDEMWISAITRGEILFGTRAECGARRRGL